MALNRNQMLEIVRGQLALDMNCDPQDFEKDGVVFAEADPRQGIWIDERQTPHLKAVTMGRGTVVSADKELLPTIQPILEPRSRDELFNAPFLFGHTIYYIPDSGDIEKLPFPQGLTFHVREGEQIHLLYALPGFRNAMQYNRNHPRPDMLVLYAKQGDRIAGIAGASADSKSMWQIGIDVKPVFGGIGLAACLVSRLAAMIVQRDIVPFYGASSTNITAQSVAVHSGLAPAWMCNTKHTLDGKGPYEGGGMEPAKQE